MSLVRILDRAPVHSIDDAIAVMKAIDESLPGIARIQFALAGMNRDPTMLRPVD